MLYAVRGCSKRSPLSNAGRSGKRANNYIGRRNYIHNIYSILFTQHLLYFPKLLEFGKC
ncbi:hypothetical protein PVAP13_2KG073200 [Panicum virgatum]|uniref:Uncharacterized protein n=1 Tax=Panicum virgatum TaxID=38727 RepID=A0A8T0W468_PANVG|nr:hypothetical protein PVAP13_2KG073200 [Panicum virgatum]